MPDEITSPGWRALKAEWLPIVWERYRAGRPMRLLMIGVLLTPLLGALALFVCALCAAGTFGWAGGTAFAALSGTSYLNFVYLGKLISCGEVPIKIEYAVTARNERKLDKAIEEITCYGQFRTIVDDYKRIVGDVGRPSAGGDRGAGGA
jgi:hypothetical protein